MRTLCIHYKLDPNRLADFRTYAETEQEVISRSGGAIVGYYLPTDFAGPTDEAYGIIEFASLADYERYREVLGKDPDHKKNAARLEASGAVRSVRRSFIARVEPRAAKASR